jgi:hypothetical protein
MMDGGEEEKPDRSRRGVTFVSHAKLLKVLCHIIIYIIYYIIKQPAS